MGVEVDGEEMIDETQEVEEGQEEEPLNLPQLPLRNEADPPRGRQSAISSRPRTHSRRGTAAPRTRLPSRLAILNIRALAAPGIGCIRPFVFAPRLSGPAQPTGFPSTAKRLHIYKCIPRLGIRFSLRRYRATSVASYAATHLQSYASTR